MTDGLIALEVHGPRKSVTVLKSIGRVSRFNSGGKNLGHVST